MPLHPQTTLITCIISPFKASQSWDWLRGQNFHWACSNTGQATDRIPSTQRPHRMHLLTISRRTNQGDTAKNSPNQHDLSNQHVKICFSQQDRHRFDCNRSSVQSLHECFGNHSQSLRHDMLRDVFRHDGKERCLATDRLRSPPAQSHAVQGPGK